MRVLLLMRGIPASGKSTWIKQQGLDKFTLCADDLRLLVAAPVLTPSKIALSVENSTPNSSKILLNAENLVPNLSENSLNLDENLPNLNTQNSVSNLNENLLNSSKNSPNLNAENFTPNLSENSTPNSNKISSNADKSSFLLYKISQNNDNFVWQLLFELLEMRMKNGDFCLVDATHTSNDAIRRYENLCEKYRYRIFVVDFSECPLSLAKERNLGRLGTSEAHKFVPNKVIEFMHKRLQNAINSPLPKRFAVIKPEEFDFVVPKATDLNKYRRIHHIGDIQGSYSAVLDYFKFISKCDNADISSIKECLKPDEYYIFVGDFLDRGVENGEVLRAMCDIMELPNVCLLEGNHEKWLRAWGEGEDVGESEFGKFTAPDIEGKGLTKQHARALCRRLRQCAYYEFDGKIVLVTHGGLPTLPSNLALIATRTMIYGSGEYEDMSACAEIWAQSTAANAYQIFGHRNQTNLPMRVNERSFVLEGGVEFGGELRVVILSKSGEKFEDDLQNFGENLGLNLGENLQNLNSNLDKNLIKNSLSNLNKNSQNLSENLDSNLGKNSQNLHENFGENLGLNLSENSQNLNKNLDKNSNQNSAINLHENSSENSAQNALNSRFQNIRVVYDKDDNFTQIYVKNRVFADAYKYQNDIALLNLVRYFRTSKLIKERIFGDISSFNFAKEVFHKRAWDKLTCKARGLYIDTKRLKIVARSYDKFFNLNEREETRLERLAELAYPLTAYIKENGFLGIVSTHENELFCSSKSDLEGEFAKIAQSAINRHFEAYGKRAEFIEFLSKNNFSCIFEIIEPKIDPHIIKYEAPHIVLLDTVYNEVEYKKLDFEKLQNLAQKFGFLCKEKLCEIADFDGLKNFIEEVSAKDYVCTAGRHFGKEIEGFVVEDRKNFAFKLKLHYYSFWKSMRSALAASLKQGRVILNKQDKIKPEALEFGTWLENEIRTKGAENLVGKSIIDIREEFLKSLL